MVSNVMSMQRTMCGTVTVEVSTEADLNPTAALKCPSRNPSGPTRPPANVLLGPPQNRGGVAPAPHVIAKRDGANAMEIDIDKEPLLVKACRNTSKF